jgi:multidrug efflux system outer membrane protein
MKFLLSHFRAAALAMAATSLLLSGCRVGPNYHRPKLNTPGVYRGAPPLTAQSASTPQLAWQDVFHDPVLQKLIRTALAQNQNLAVAASRIEEARAALHLANKQIYPGLEAQASFADQRLSQQGLPGNKINGNPEGSATIGSVNMGWEIDFWGRYRRARESARAQMLATVAAQQAVQVTLVAEVASAYYQLRAYDDEIRSAQQSLALRQQSLQLTEAREKGGVSSLLDVRQAQTLVTETQQAITNLQRLMPQTENDLRLLLGEYPGPIPRGIPLAQDRIPAIPAGLPSQLLERRPDIREAEENLRAANANIGVVHADYFPNIGLTSSVGTESSAFHNLLAGGATAWLIQPVVNLPLFTAGRIHSREQQAIAAEHAALHSYRAVVQRAFREVSDALIARQQAHELRLEQQRQVKTTEDAAFLSRARYKGGVANYLEVLETERTSLGAKLNLAQAQYEELDASVRLYRALGGGWKP